MIFSLCTDVKRPFSIERNIEFYSFQCGAAIPFICILLERREKSGMYHYVEKCCQKTSKLFLQGSERDVGRLG
jgi:hypothetical protein